MFRAGATGRDSEGWRALPFLLGAAFLIAACGGEFGGYDDESAGDWHHEYSQAGIGNGVPSGDSGQGGSADGFPSAAQESSEVELAEIEDQVTREVAAQFDVWLVDDAGYLTPAEPDRYMVGERGVPDSSVRFDDGLLPGPGRVDGNSSPDPIPAREAADGLLTCSALPSPELKELCLREVRARSR